MTITADQAARFAEAFTAMADNMGRAVLGKDHVIRLALTCLLAELVDSARDLGTPVAAGVTRQAQAVSLGGDPRFDQLAWEADLVIFGLSEPTASDSADNWSRVDALRLELVAAAPRWRRWLAPFHPGSLRPGRYRASGASGTVRPLETVPQSPLVTGPHTQR